MNRYFSLASADLVVPNQEAWHLLWDFRTLCQISDTLPGNTPLQNKALVAANEIINAFDHKDPSTVNKCRKIAESVFGEGWQGKGEKIYEEGVHKENLVWGIGHCHIDTAWYGVFHVGREILTYLGTSGSGFVPPTYVSRVTLTREYIALQRHAAEGCTVVVNTSRPHGTISRTSVRVQFCSGVHFAAFPWFHTYRGVHIAIQVARATLSKVVRTCQGQGP